MELTFWIAGVKFGVNLDLVLDLISVLILVLTFNPVFGINFAGVNFLILIDAQGEVTECRAKRVARGIKTRAKKKKKTNKQRAFVYALVSLGSKGCGIHPPKS